MNQSQMSVAAPDNDRPILSEAKRKSLVAVVGTAVSAALSFGVISPELAEQINSAWAYVLGAIVTVLPIVTSVLHALGIVKGAEPKTTPVDSPSDADGTPLVPLHATELDQPDEIGTETAVETTETTTVDVEPDPAPALGSGPSSVANVVIPDVDDDSTGRHAQLDTETMSMVANG